MGSFTDYLENKVLDHILGGPDYTRPATVYVGLSTTTITDAGGNITEPVGNAYARISVTNNATNWPAASGGSKSNGVELQFPEATGAWGTVIDFFLSDASSGGNIMGYGTLPVPKSPTAGDILRYQVDALEVTLT